jgi:hypothetical protein
VVDFKGFPRDSITDVVGWRTSSSTVGMLTSIVSIGGR